MKYLTKIRDAWRNQPRISFAKHGPALSFLPVPGVPLFKLVGIAASAIATALLAGWLYGKVQYHAGRKVGLADGRVACVEEAAKQRKAAEDYYNKRAKFLDEWAKKERSKRLASERDWNKKYDRVSALLSRSRKTKATCGWSRELVREMRR